MPAASVVELQTLSAPSLGPVPRPSRAVVIAAFALALLAIWWHGPLLDLHIYRLGGQSVRHGGDDLYQMRDQATQLPFTYPPFAALLFAPLAVLAEPAAAVLMTVLTVLAAIRLAGLVVGQFELSVPRQTRMAGVVLIALLASEPVISTVLFGQVNLILLALIAQAWFRPYGRWALIGLGVAAGIKLTPAIFILGLFARGRWRDGLRASVAAAATLLIGAIYLGRPTHTFFLGGQGFSDTRIGGTAFISNQSLNGVLWRWSGFGGQRLLWIILAVAVVATSMWTARILHAAGQSMLAFCVVALAGLMASPVSWTHHWVVAVPLSAALIQPFLTNLPRRPRGVPAAPRTVMARIRPYWRPVLAAGWLGISCSWAIWMVPRGNDGEYHQTFVDFLVGNAYLELAIVTVAALAGYAAHLRAADRRAAGSVVEGADDDREKDSSAAALF